MTSFFQDLKKTLQIGIEKTEEYGKIGKLKVDIVAIKNKLDKNYRELGEETYRHLKSGKKTDLAQTAHVKTLYAEVESLLKQIAKKEAEIKEVHKQGAAKPASAQKRTVTKSAKAKPVTRKAPAKKKTTAKKTSKEKTASADN